MPHTLHTAAFGEVMLRLSAPGREPLLKAAQLHTHIGGAEANVAAGLCALGHSARIITAFPDNALGAGAAGELRRAGLDTRHILMREGRLGLYFHTSGAMRRPAEILYDRTGSAFALTPAKAWGWEAMLDGANWLHLSGITPALGAEPAKATLAAARAARAKSIPVSFDFNYREMLWGDRVSEANAILKELVAETTLLFASAGDLARVCAFARQSDGAKDLEAGATAAFAAFPALERIATTFRAARGTLDQSLTASLASRSGTVTAGPEPLDGIVERIGGGDAFAAGLIDALARGSDDATALADALTVMAVKHSRPGDLCAVSPSDITAWREGRDVKR
ncbi:MAG: sugar kinase [Glycocaulis sp.]